MQRIVFIHFYRHVLDDNLLYIFCFQLLFGFVRSYCFYINFQTNNARTPTTTGTVTTPKPNHIQLMRNK